MIVIVSLIVMLRKLLVPVIFWHAASLHNFIQLNYFCTCIYMYYFMCVLVHVYA